PLHYTTCLLFSPVPPFLAPPSAPDSSSHSLHDALPIFFARRVNAQQFVAVHLQRDARHLFIHLRRIRPYAHHIFPIIRKRHAVRSEEHTSELQSPYDLVCRLLPEKKNAE